MTTTPPGSIALAGAGWAGTVHALAAQSLGVPLLMVASRMPERASALAFRHGARASRFDELPGAATTVIVATPPSRHHDDALSALAAGATVIVEKPLCSTLAQADALVLAGGPRIAYAENLLFSPAVRQVMARLPALGALHHLEARTIQALPTWGGYTASAWGGGVLFDLGVHPLALVLWLASPARAVSVEARLEGSPSHDVDEHAEVAVTFDSGLRASVVASWRATAAASWSLEAASTVGVVRAELVPNVHVEHDGQPIALPQVSASIPVLEQLGYCGQLASFQAAFAAGRQPVPGATDGRAILEVVCACYRSARLGRAVELPFDGPRDRTPLELWRQ